MGKQINFYMDEETQCRFIGYLCECNFLTISIDAVAMSAASNSVFSVYLYKESYGPLIYSKTIETQIDCRKSSVIQFQKTNLNETQNRILRGRLWMEDRYYAGNDSVVLKSREFEKDYQKLVRWVKKNVPYRKIRKGNYEVLEYASESLEILIADGFIYSI